MINFKKSTNRRKYVVVGSLLVATFIAAVTKNIVFIVAPFIALLFSKSLDLQKELSRANERLKALEQSFNDQNNLVLGKFEIIECSVNKLIPFKTIIDSRELLKIAEYNRQQIEKVNHDLVLMGKEYRDEIGALYSSEKQICQSVDRISSDFKLLKKNLKSEIQSALVSPLDTWFSNENVENTINKIIESGSPVISELLKNSEGFVQVRIDKSLEEQFKIIKQVTSETCLNELIIDKKASRQVFIDALKVSQQRLILICPWISSHAIDDEVLYLMEDALIRGVFISIGWGAMKDINKVRNKYSSIAEGLVKEFELTSDEWKYSAIRKLEKLKDKYPKLMSFTLLSTHEKILICDRRFVMIGSHNYMTSNISSPEREMGIKTDDPRMIGKLINKIDSEAEEVDNTKINQRPKLKKSAKTNDYN